MPEKFPNPEGNYNYYSRYTNRLARNRSTRLQTANIPILNILLDPPTEMLKDPQAELLIDLPRGPLPDPPIDSPTGLLTDPSTIKRPG